MDNSYTSSSTLALMMSSNEVLSKYGFLMLLLGMVIGGATFITTFKTLPVAFMQIGGLHDIAFLIGIGVIIISLKVRSTFGRLVGDSFIYIISGVVFLTVVHAFQFFFVTPFQVVQLGIIEQRTIFHLLFYAGFLSLGYAFYTMIKRVR